MNRRHLLQLAAAPCTAGLATLATSFSAQAQLGAKVSRLLVGSAPGGPSDVQGRALGQAMRGAGGGNIVVDNRPGAAGRIAVQSLKTLPTDGSTLLLAPGWLMSLAPQTDRTPAFDPEQDLAPVGGLCTQEFALVVGSGTGARTLSEFVAATRRRGDAEPCASAGIGSMGHLVASMLERSVGITLQPVPYKGAAPALQDVQAGHVSSYIGALGDMVRMHHEGLVRVLATSGHRRSKFLPDVPTFEEAGAKGVHAVDWTALFVDVRVPAAALARQTALLRQAMQDRTLLQVLERVGVEPGYFEPAEARSRLKTDTATMRELVARFNLKATT